MSRPEDETAGPYVVLHHTGHGSAHFDLLFEDADDPGGGLTTFRCPRWPPAVGDAWEELPPHRRAYLTYEGPVSGGRGEVRRIDAGRCDVHTLWIDPPKLLLALTSDAGGPLQVTIEHRPGAVMTGWFVDGVAAT